ncbi:MAG: response regulator [Lysobacteraceae bacterium]
MPTIPDLHGLHLLLVEDDYLLALGLADSARDLGAEVFGPVGAVDDALALVRQLPELDAAILDVNLGNETIYPVADALLARGVPFVFSTASDIAALPARFRGVPVCRKPFDLATFHAALGRLRTAA